MEHSVKKDEGKHKSFIYYFGPFFFIVLAIAIGMAFFIGLYPGRLVTDTIGNISAALEGRFTLIYPPIIELFFRLIFIFDKSLFTVFFLQIFIYWFSVSLFSIYFLLRNSRFLAFFTFLVALFPYNIYLHSTLIKDVWLQETYLLFFALVSLSSLRKPSAYMATCLFLVGFAVVLLRNTFIALIPTICLSIVWIFLKENTSHKCYKKIIILTIMLAALVWGLGNAFLVFVTHGEIRKIDNISQLATFDLLGISIRSDHQGVTKQLSKEAQNRLSQAYFGENVLWRGKIGDEAMDLRVLLRFSPDIKYQWLNEIRQHFFLYIQHRIHVFQKLFNGTGQSHTAGIKRNIHMGPKRFRNTLTHIEIESIDQTLVWEVYKYMVDWYFKLFKSNWWILSVSVSMMLICLTQILKNKNPDTSSIICVLMNLCAWSYFGPYILMLCHSEVRYVFPGLSLILFSFPFFVLFLKRSYKIKKATFGNIHMMA
jgi:hypothetical protein